MHEVFQSECQITTTKVKWGEEHTTLQTNKETNLKDKHRNDSLYLVIFWTSKQNDQWSYNNQRLTILTSAACAAILSILRMSFVDEPSVIWFNGSLTQYAVIDKFN